MVTKLIFYMCLLRATTCSICWDYYLLIIVNIANTIRKSMGQHICLFDARCVIFTIKEGCLALCVLAHGTTQFCVEIWAQQQLYFEKWMKLIW